MSRYLLSVWTDEPYEDVDLSDPEVVRQMTQTDEVTTEMQRAGAWVFHAGLKPRAASSTVARTVDGDIVVTDGPFAETKEQMAGFWIIDAPDPEAACGWAARASAACERPVELRAVHG